MLTDNRNDISDINIASTVEKLNAAMQQLRKRQEDERMLAGPMEFDPSPNNALGVRARAIRELYSRQGQDTLTDYLRGLGYVRGRLISARDVLNDSGKKKYEAYIKNAVETLPARLYGLKPYYLNILTSLMAIPFRRNAEKDRRELSDSLCLVANHIENYRYRGADERYRAYAETITRNIDTEQLPPMIAAMIIQEVGALVDSAITANVLGYVDSGLTHEEYWRNTDPEDYAEVYPDGKIPDDADQLESLDAYEPQYGIAKQSLWYGLDDCVDDFIINLAGGLLYSKYPL